MMMVLLDSGGLQNGGMNFDAKTRRNSTDLEDIFIGHINSMDILAKGLIIADNILKDSSYSELKKERYASFNEAEGHQFSAGKLNLSQLSRIALNQTKPELRSGKQELFESIINKYL